MNPAAICNRVLDVVKRMERDAWERWYTASQASIATLRNPDSTLDEIDAAGNATASASAKLVQAQATLDAVLAEMAVAAEHGAEMGG